MSESVSASEFASADNQSAGSVVERMTTEFDDLYFAEEFSEGDSIYFQLGNEDGIATVENTEPADGTFLLDVSAFDCDDRFVMLPDRSTTGSRTSNLGRGWGIIAVPTTHTLASDDSEADYVLCDCGAVNKAGRGQSIHVGHQHSDQQESDQDDASREQTDGALGEFGELPEPREDPVLKYVHPGKQYRIRGNRTFTVVEYLPDACPQLDGIVIIESDGGDRLYSEHERDRAGVSKDVVEGHIPERTDRAVYTATGILSSLRELEIGEVDPNSYADLYWERQDW